jgi:hypothetical protein
MFNFFTSNKSRAASATYHDSINCYSALEKSFTSSTWLGRTVYFFSAVVGGIAGFAIIHRLVHHIFAKSFTKGSSSAPIPQPTPSPHQPHSPTPTPKSEELFDPAEDEKATKKKKDLFVADKPEMDDEAFARMLEAEFSEGYKKIEDLDPHAEDEAYARALQRSEYEHDFKSKSGPSPHTQMREDEALALRLQQELFATSMEKMEETSTDKAILTKDELVTDSTENASEELAKMQNTEQAAFQILSTPNGLVPCETLENDFDPTSKKITVYEPAGGLLRGVVATLTKDNPQAISAAALRSQRDAPEVDFDQYMLLKLKLFSHVEQVKGLVTLPSGKNVKLEGFWEVFAAPMVISSYETFSKISRFFNLKDREWILAQFNQLIFADYVSKKEVEDLSLKLRMPDFLGPVVLQGGFIDHCAVMLWMQNFLLYIDRSSIHTDPGVYVLHLPERELLTEDFIRECVEREKLNEKNYQILERLVSQLGAVVVYYEQMPAQIVGNCTHATMEGVLLSLMAIRTLINRKIDRWDGVDWNKAFTKVQPEQEKWAFCERKLLFDDMISEIEEWLAHKNDFGKRELKKVYQDLLTSWLHSHRVFRDSADVMKVQKLLNALQKDTWNPATAVV